MPKIRTLILKLWTQQQAPSSETKVSFFIPRHYYALNAHQHVKKVFLLYALEYFDEKTPPYNIGHKKRRRKNKKRKKEKSRVCFKGFPPRTPLDRDTWWSFGVEFLLLANRSLRKKKFSSFFYCGTRRGVFHVLQMITCDCNRETGLGGGVRGCTKAKLFWLTAIAFKYLFMG